MARNSVYTNVTARRTLSPATYAATVTGAGVDRKVGNKVHRTAMVVVSTGVITDGTHAIEVQDSDDDVTFAAVADEFLQGSEPAIGAADDDTVFFIGYKGYRRYVRAVSTVTGAPVTGGLYGAVILLGEPSRHPVSHS